MIILNIHDGRDEERDNRHQDADRPAEDVPEADAERVRNGTRDQQAERHHGGGASLEQGEDASLHFGRDRGLHDRREGTVGKHLRESDHEIGGKQEREQVRGDETDKHDAQPNADDADEGCDDAAFESAPDAEQDAAHDHTDAEN